MKIKKFIDNLKWRAGYKSLATLTEREILILDDNAYYIQKKNITNFHFDEKKFLRMKKITEIISFKLFIFFFFIFNFFSSKIEKCYGFFHKLVTNLPTIRPEKKVKIIWDLIILFIISFYFYIIPMQLSFDMFFDDELETTFHKYHYNLKLASFLIIFPELMLIIDTLLKFITGFYENGVVVTDKFEIIHHYLKNGLIYDILSYLPVLMQGLIKQMFPNMGLILKFFQFLMFFKIKRVQTAISNYEEIIASNGKRDFFLKFVKLMYVIIFITHLNACLWHAIAYFYPASRCCTWIDNSDLKEAHWVSRYIYTFYWSISVMATIGFGEKISPQNDMECIIGVIILIVSVLLFGFCINYMKLILDMISKPQNEYKSLFL